MTYRGLVQNPSLGQIPSQQEGIDAQTKPVCHRADGRGARSPRGASPAVYVTVSGRGPGEDDPFGRRGLGEQGDRRAVGHPPTRGEQMAEALLL